MTHTQAFIFLLALGLATFLGLCALVAACRWFVKMRRRYRINRRLLERINEEWL